MFGTEPIRAQVGTEQVRIAVSLARVVGFENEFVVRQSRGEQQSEVDDAQDKRMKAARDDDEGEEGLRVKPGKDRDQNLSR